MKECLRLVTVLHLLKTRLATEFGARRSMSEAMLANKEIFWFYGLMVKF